MFLRLLPMRSDHEIGMIAWPGDPGMVGKGRTMTCGIVGRRRFIGMAVGILAGRLAPRADAQTSVDLALVLAVDASGSVDDYRFGLQQRGYADAFRSPRVIKAIRSGAAQAIAVTMVQWTGPAMQRHVIGWTVVRDEASAHLFADLIETTPRQLYGGGTSISGAIDFSRLLLIQAPLASMRRVIDISGDGANNRGRPAADARDDAVKDNIGINGLPILALEPFLDRYYYDNVIGGPGAFMIPAESYETFADAVIKKLIMEIASAE
jgi:hypothetical protein